MFQFSILFLAHIRIRIPTAYSFQRMFAIRWQFKTVLFAVPSQLWKYQAETLGNSKYPRA